MGNKISRIKMRKEKGEWVEAEKTKQPSEANPSKQDNGGTDTSTSSDEVHSTVPPPESFGPVPEPELVQNTIFVNSGEMLAEEQLMSLQSVEIIMNADLVFSDVWRLSNLRRLRITAPGKRVSIGNYVDLSQLKELEILAEKVNFGDHLSLPNLQSLGLFSLKRIKGELSVPNLQNLDADLGLHAQNQLVVALLPSPSPQPVLKPLPVNNITPKRVVRPSKGSYQSFVSLRTPPAVVRRPGLSPLPLKQSEVASKMKPLPQDPLIKSAMGTLRGL